MYVSTHLHSHPGAASFLPLLLYALALYLLTTTDFIPSLPYRFHNIAKYVLIAFIPLIIVLNELSSFVGITYRKSPQSHAVMVQYTQINGGVPHYRKLRWYKR